ncbi:hypothetical protein [Nocardia otitidiscaviarum]|uniref:hypothetical protein n=1 Tax=Nocardia otitidiscaviarum TaxID=1823 RepID=UPI0024539930|nr:hypothetical protein [Nocardia otitidiscaviarum]
MADTRTVAGVELVKVGTWHTMTGEWTVTAADLRSALAAHQARVLRKPIVKLGHTDPRFDGEPALGHIDNLRLTDDGSTLVGDLLGVPAWLAEAMPTTYPDRSVEALTDYEAADGTTYPLVLTAVALLGTARPSITDLASLQDLVAATAGSGRRIILAACSGGTDRHRTVTVAAARRRRLHRK